MKDNEKGRTLIDIPADGNYIEILGHRIDGFESFEAFLEHLKKYAELEETVKVQKVEIKRLNGVIKNFIATKERQKAEIERLSDENYHLRGYSDSIVKRMHYLFQSKTIYQFDEIDRRTYQYKKDVTKFDEEFKRYKEAFEKMSEEKVFSVDLDIHSIKAEAKKEVFEELISMCDAPHWCVWLSEITDLAEKMGVKVDVD